MTLVWTAHARQRWDERLAPFDPDDEYARTKVARRGLRRHIAAACPAHGEYATRQFKGIYYLCSPNAVWVMAAPETVVTVWPMPEELRFKKRSFEKKRERLLRAWAERTSGSKPEVQQ